MSKPYSLSITIPELPKLQADVMQRWERSKYRKHWHQLIYYAARKKGLPTAPLTQASIIGIRYCCGTQPDRINVWNSFKAPVDGLTRAGIIQDDNPTILTQEDYYAVRVPHRKDQRIVIEVAGE